MAPASSISLSQNDLPKSVISKEPFRGKVKSSCRPCDGANGGKKCRRIHTGYGAGHPPPLLRSKSYDGAQTGMFCDKVVPDLSPVITHTRTRVYLVQLLQVSAVNVLMRDAGRIDVMWM